MLQLDEVSLYASGLALLEQNLHTLDNMGLFENQVRNKCVFGVFLLSLKAVKYIPAKCRSDETLTWGLLVSVWYMLGK